MLKNTNDCFPTKVKNINICFWIIKAFLAIVRYKAWPERNVLISFMKSKSTHLILAGHGHTLAAVHFMPFIFPFFIIN